MNRGMTNFHAGRPLLTWATILTVLATAGSILSGCSFKPMKQHLIRVELPSVAPENLRLRSPASAAYTTVPSSQLELKCFALNITGPGIPINPTKPCSDPSGYVGLIAGYYPIDHAGGTVMEVSVPAGPARRIQVLAFTSLTGTCGSVETDSGNEGEPYVVGEASVDLYSDKDVEIIASFDPATATPAFQSCGGGTGGPGVEIDPSAVPLKEIYKGMTVAPSALSLESQTLMPPEQLLAASTADGFTVPLPLYSALNSALLTAPMYKDASYVSHYPALQLRWNVSHLDPALYQVMDLQLQVGFDFVGAGCGGPRSLNFEFMTDSGPRFMPSRSYDMMAPTRNLQWNPFYRTYGDLIQTIAGEKMIVLNIYADFDDYGAGCTADIAVGFANLRVPATPPPLQLNINSAEPLVAGRGYGVGAFGGLPPYQFSSSVSGALGGAEMGGSWIASSTAAEETVVVTDALGAQVSRTFGLARFVTTGPAAFVAGCNSSPIGFEMQMAGVPVAVSHDESLSFQGPGNFGLEYYATSDCSGTQIYSTTIPAGGFASKNVYVKVISGWGSSMAISGFPYAGGVVESHSGSYSDASCAAPADVFYQTNGGPATCDANRKAQSFTPTQDLRLSSVSLRNGIEMWPFPSPASQVDVGVYVDSGSVGPGTLIASGSCIAPSGFFDSECLATFPSLPTLSANQKYWIVVSHPTAGTQFCWQGSSTDNLLGGEAMTYTGSSWVAAAAGDFIFHVNACGP